MKNQFSASLSRRSFLQVAGIGAATAALAACVAPSAAPQAGASAGASASASGTVDIQFWDMVWGPTEYVETAQKLVEQFNAANPGIKVTYQSTPWSGWPQVFTTAIGSGTAPDVSTGGGFQPVQFYVDGAILEIDDVLPEVGADKFAEGTVDAMVWEGHNLAIPWNLDVRCAFYRKDLIETAPTNWEELRAALKAVTTDKVYGMAFAGNNPLGWQQMFSLIHNNGGGLYSEAGELDVMNERNLEALEFVASLVKDGVIHPGSAGFTSDDLAKAWSEGSVASTIWGFGFQERAGDLKASTAVLPPLSGPHGDKGTLTWINGIMLYNQTKHPAETKTFAKWWSENNGPLWTEGHCGPLPARKSIAADPYFQDNEYAKPVLNDWVPIAKGLGNKKSGTSPVLGKIDGSGILNTLCTDILQGLDVTQSLQKAADALAEIK